MKHSNHHYFLMACIMILSGLLSTMNVWADQIDDLRLSLNDLYMILLMTGWMLLFMGIMDQRGSIIWIGILLVGGMLWCIRTQFAISESQYIQGMIPHHSMAVHMSKQLLTKENTIPSFLHQLIRTQEDEISWMKQQSEY
jgi:hypothetical protein